MTFSVRDSHRFHRRLQLNEQLSEYTKKLTEAEGAKASAEKVAAEKDAEISSLSEQLKSVQSSLEQLTSEHVTLKDAKQQSDLQSDDLKNQLTAALAKSVADEQREVSLCLTNSSMHFLSMHARTVSRSFAFVHDD